MMCSMSWSMVGVDSRLSKWRLYEIRPQVRDAAAVADCPEQAWQVTSRYNSTFFRASNAGFSRLFAPGSGADGGRHQQAVCISGMAPCWSVWVTSRANFRCRRPFSPSSRIPASCFSPGLGAGSPDHAARRSSNCSPRPGSNRPWSAASMPPLRRCPPTSSSSRFWCAASRSPSDHRRRFPFRQGGAPVISRGCRGPVWRTVLPSRRWAVSRSTVVSSSGVRAALAEGEMEHAARLLGRPYVIDDPGFMHGDKIGRQLGFATANIASSTIRCR